jgi:ACS family tartrate transporter-like MFS transporter
MEMQKERRTVESARTFTILQSLFSLRVLALAAVHFGQAAVSVGLAVLVAQMVKQLGLTNMQTGFTTAIPYALGTVGMLVWGHVSDRMDERRWNLTASCATMAVGCLAAGLLGNSYLSVLGLSLATIGLYASNAHLFPLPAVILTGPALASGIAWVNSLGILGGSAGPTAVGWIRDVTGSFSGGLYALAGFGLLAAIVAAVGVQDKPSPAPAAEALEATA